MASEGQPLQFDLFSGELVDSRSAYQKRKDKNRDAPQQLLMFKTPEIVQYGVSARPWLNDAPRPQLVLEIQETRTPEEIERDLMREAQKYTASFIDDPAPSLPEVAVVSKYPASGVIFDAQSSSRPIGLRTQLRAQSIPVRTRRYPIRSGNF